MSKAQIVGLTMLLVGCSAAFIWVGLYIGFLNALGLFTSVILLNAFFQIGAYLLTGKIN